MRPIPDDPIVRSMRVSEILSVVALGHFAFRKFSFYFSGLLTHALIPKSRFFAAHILPEADFLLTPRPPKGRNRALFILF